MLTIDKDDDNDDDNNREMKQQKQKFKKVIDSFITYFHLHQSYMDCGCGY